MSLEQFIKQNKEQFNDKNMSSKSEELFAKSLKTALHTPKNGKLIYLKYLAVAASVALLITIGINFTNNLKQEKQKMALVNNLNNTSAGTRLAAIYEFDEKYVKEDNQIIEMLLDILHNDSNANVKIATIDALIKFPSNEKIRMNLILALETEIAPLVQIKLIKSLSILRENRAEKSLKKLIDNKETLPIVTSNASLAMAEISQYN